MVQRILWLNYKEDEEEEKNERKREKKMNTNFKKSEANKGKMIPWRVICK